MRYKRVFLPGGTFFLTLVTYRRMPIFANADSVDLLRASFRYTQQKHPFSIPAICILPDHIHLIITLPENESDYPLRIRLTKSYFSHRFQSELCDIPESRVQKKEKAVWQRRYWEHLIRDERDMEIHTDYIHYNPVKHGYVLSPKDWNASSFHHYVQMELLDDNWGSTEPIAVKNLVLPD